jgi:catechol 2,3-dioxygenase-like lactoylglutathione lyase family enzyme
MMLNRFYLNPILPAQDGDRARTFYRDVLGLDLLTGPTDDPMVFGAASGSSIALTELPDRVPPPYPMVSFMVEDIENLVETLKAPRRIVPEPRRRQLRGRRRQGVSGGHGLRCREVRLPQGH